MTGGNLLVAIPTLNEAARIETVYRQLLASLPDDRNVRFLVLDGGSNDATREIVAAMALRDRRIQLVDNPQRLQSAAINQAARLAATAEAVLIRAEAHTDYPAGVIAAVVAALVDNEADSVVVPMDSVGLTCVGRAIAWVSDSPVGSGGSAHRGGQQSGFVDHGHHAGWKLDSFRKFGGYDEHYSHNEDAEFDCRINRGGGRIWLDAAIRLRYFVRPTLTALARQYRNYGRGRSRTVRRHPGSLRLRQLAVPLACIGMLGCLAASAVWPALLLVPAIYLAILTAVSAQMAMVHRSACGALAGVAAMVMHFAWTAGFLEGIMRIREVPWQPSVQPADAC